MTRFQLRVGIALMMFYWIGQTARAQNDCGFSNYRFGQISDWLDGAVIHKVTPEYPAKHKPNGVAGTIRNRVLVDKQGRVVRTCPLYVSGEPKPDPVLF